MHTRVIFIHKWNEGETGKQGERQRESVRVCEHCRKMDVGVRHKTGRWKNPLTSFWNTLDDNWYDNMLHILHINYT